MEEYRAITMPDDPPDGGIHRGGGWPSAERDRARPDLRVSAFEVNHGD